MWPVCYMSNLLHRIAIGENIPLYGKEINFIHIFNNFKLIDHISDWYPTFNYTHTCGLVLSSLKKLKTFWGEIGSQIVVAALRTTPLGWPGSVLLWTVTRTPTSFNPESVVHRWPFDVLMLEQKLFTILWASFIMLLLPSGDGITGSRTYTM